MYDVLQSSPSLLAFVIHRIRKFHDFDQTLLGAMKSSLEHVNRLNVPSDIGFSGRELHVPFEKRNDLLRDGTPRRDRINEHIFVPRFRMDPSRLEEIPEELEKITTVLVLIDEKLRINIETRLCGRMALDRDAEATLSLEHTSQEPPTLLVA